MNLLSFSFILGSVMVNFLLLLSSFNALLKAHRINPNFKRTMSLRESMLISFTLNQL